uniref:Uncharacterized protein n=1 Tax=Podoviridae sp. ctG4L18 TaxID=2825234 RepID=A0A8S5UNX9_9CAUD|nr:MAG TPA: hypothetical protein [Podoviridae sp. ctG4L18]
MLSYQKDALLVLAQSLHRNLHRKDGLKKLISSMLYRRCRNTRKEILVTKEIYSQCL